MQFRFGIEERLNQSKKQKVKNKIPKTEKYISKTS